MHPNCTHSLSNGQRCSAPAIHGSQYCRHHDPQRPKKQAEEESGDHEPMVLPPLLDKPSLLTAVNQVVQALAAGSIKVSVAHALLSGIKLSGRLLTEIAEESLALRSGISTPSQVIDQQAFRDLEELIEVMETGNPEQFRQCYLAQKKKCVAQIQPLPVHPPAKHAAKQEIAIAASSDPQKPVQAFSISNPRLSEKTTDRFVAEMMAQAQAMLANAPRTNPLFTRP